MLVIMFTPMKAVKFNKAQYARNYKKAHHSYEVYFYRLVKGAMIEQIKSVRTYLKNNSLSSLETYIKLVVSPEPMQKAYLKGYQYIGLKHAEFAYNFIQSLGQRKSLTFFSEEWRRKIMQLINDVAGDRITSVNETTIEAIRTIMADAIARNLTLEESVKYLVSAISDPAFIEYRALRIARTESTFVSNYASQMAGEDADYECGKIWIPIIDKKTRQSHKGMGNVPVIGINDYFAVKNSHGGIDQMQFPGDPKASADNVINCRCTHAVTPLEDEDGLPILKANPVRSFAF